MNVFQIITDRIMEQLRKGTIPWEKPWTGIRGGAYSHVTGKPYSLLNQMLAGKPGEYLTFRQCVEEGGTVKKGEKSSIIVFYKPLSKTKIKDNGEEEAITIPHLVYYNVFHIDQCDGITRKFIPETMPQFLPNEEADRITASYFDRTGCAIQHVEQGSAYYNPDMDAIVMPLKEQFANGAGYYNTLFHEIGHSTGHHNRLDRQINNTYADEKYSREELVAELTAAAAMNSLGMETDATIRNTSAYIKNWLSALKNDQQMIVWAASRAEKALRLIMNEAPVEQCGEPAAAVAAPQVVKPAISFSGMHNAAAAFALDCKKRFKDSNPSIAGAFANNGRQFITDGHIAVAYEKPLDGLTMVDDTVENRVDADAIMKGARFGHVLPLPLLKDIKAQLKLAGGKKRGATHFTQLDNVFVNTAFLIRTMELLGMEVGKARTAGQHKPLYIQGEGCEAIVMPVRLADASGSDVWHPKISA